MDLKLSRLWLSVQDGGFGFGLSTLANDIGLAIILNNNEYLMNFDENQNDFLGVPSDLIGW